MQYDGRRSNCSAGAALGVGAVVYKLRQKMTSCRKGQEGIVQRIAGAKQCNRLRISCGAINSSHTLVVPKIDCQE